MLYLIKSNGWNSDENFNCWRFSEYSFKRFRIFRRCEIGMVETPPRFNTYARRLKSTDSRYKHRGVCHNPYAGSERG